MAKKRRGRYPCESCEDTFKTPQAKWGHYRHCPGRKLSQQPATQAEAEPVGPARADHVTHRPGPDSKENKLLLLDTQEAMKQLLREAGHHAWWARWLARGAPSQVEGHTTPEEWFQVYQDLDDVLRELDHMVGSLRLDRALLFNVYHRFQVIRDHWLQYQWRDFSRNGELTPQGQAVVHEDKVLLTDVLSQIKQMLVAAR